MAVAQGYGKTVTSGTVFAYDAGDTRNSYKGQPTTNLINPDNPNIYSWWGRNVQTITQLTETYKGQPIYRISISIDNGDMLYHINERWGAGSGWYMPYVVFNANTPYIASVIYRPVSHSDTRVYGHPSNIGGWGATVDGSIDIDAQWKMHRIDRNFGATVGDNRFYHMHTPSATLGQTIIIDITNSQIEQKSRNTPFVNGTRSSTQGLLPLVGTSTLDLSNVSFDSNAQILFDGSNDRFDTGITNIVNSATYEVVLNCKGNTSGLNMYMGQYLPYLCVPDGNKVAYSDYINGGQTWIDTGAGSITTNKYYHIVCMREYNGTNTIKRIYINGNLSTSATVGGAKSAFADPNTINVGDGAAFAWYPFFGEIPIAKVYNRALSAGEVRQNYQHYKTRFNLS